MQTNTIHNMECAKGMRQHIPDESIGLVVTSPPYDNLRSYNGYSFNFEEIAQELWRVIKPGGVVVWVVGDATVKGSETGSSFRQALYFQSLGFNIHDTMIYEKTKVVPMDHKCNRYYQSFEYMFVLSKGKPSTCNYIKVPSKHAGLKAISINRKSDGEMRTDRINKQKNRIVAETKIKSNVWEYANSSVKGHPAPFPEQLANDHIISWSNPGDIVLDPFMGSGTTAKMALLNERRYIGFETSAEYCEIAEERLSNVQTTLV